jgi:hypothetical protein
MSRATALALVLLSACNAFTSADRCAGAGCEDDPGGGGVLDKADSGAGAEIEAGEPQKPPPAPPGCDGTKLPSDDACVIDDVAGVFVSASAGNSGPTAYS